MLLDVDPALARHLAAAVAAHWRRLRRDGLAVPPGLDALAAAFLASSGHGRPTLDGSGFRVDSAPMTPLTLDYRAVADVLSVSERSVRRAVADGRLTAVDVLGKRRIRTADLSAYVEALPAANMSER